MMGWKAVVSPGGLPSWQAWTATLKGATTDPTIGNGTEIARYIQYGSGSGSMIIAKYYLEFGSTTAAGSGQWRIDGPIASYASYDPGQAAMGVVQCYDSNNNAYVHGSVRYIGGAQDFDFKVDSATDGSVKSTLPFTWATGDRFSASFEYEVA